MKRFSFLMTLLAFIGLASCEEPETVVDTLTLSVDKSEIVADGEQSARFTVKYGEDDVTAEVLIYNAADNSSIIGNIFTTTEAGTYTFYAEYNGTKSNEVSVTATAVADEPEKAITLTASATTIKADGSDSVTFSVEQEGNDITAEAKLFANGEALSGNTFTTTEAGTYTFYAEYNGTKSNEVSVTATEVANEPEKPITLTASTTTIKANGSDSVTFSVEQEGKDVTAEAKLFANGTAINGSSFSTFTAGSYTFHAEKGTQKSNEVVITVEAAEDTGRTTVLAAGVTLNSGWYDVNKKGNGDNGDINMCWAATSSNILQWWQDRYKEAGNTLPAGCPDGPGTKSYPNFGPYELAIMEVFHEYWNNSRGGWADSGVVWYFEGRDIYSSMNNENRAYPYPNTGGYFRENWSSIVSTMHTSTEYISGYTTDLNNTIWRGSEKGAIRAFSDYVIDFIKHGMASMAIVQSSNFAGSGHSVTLWGYDVDNTTGLVTALYITDSDDKENKLQVYSVTEVPNAHAKIELSRPGASKWYPMALYPVSGYGSAE